MRLSLLLLSMESKFLVTFYRFFFGSNIFISNARLKFEKKKKVNAKQCPETELWLFGNYSHSSSKMIFTGIVIYLNSKNKIESCRWAISKVKTSNYLVRTWFDSLFNSHLIYVCEIYGFITKMIHYFNEFEDYKKRLFVSVTSSGTIHPVISFLKKRRY